MPKVIILFSSLKDDNAEETIDFTRWNDYLNENNEITGANYPEMIVVLKAITLVSSRKIIASQVQMMLF